MKEVIYKVVSNQKIAKDVYKMILSGDTSAITAPGQFVNLKLDGFYLRRPISVCDCSPDSLTLIYKVVGGGTELMSMLEQGHKVNALTGLGNGYNTDKSGEKPLLVGGGVGVPPLYKLCRELVVKGVKPTVVMGFNSKDDVFYEQEFKDLGAEVYVATADGSYGEKGFVTDIIKRLDYSFSTPAVPNRCSGRCLA